MGRDERGLLVDRTRPVFTLRRRPRDPCVGTTDSPRTAVKHFPKVSTPTMPKPRRGGRIGRICGILGVASALCGVSALEDPSAQGQTLDASPGPTAAAITGLTGILERQAGRLLPPAAAAMLSGGADVVIWPAANQAWIIGPDGTVADFGDLHVHNRQVSLDVVVNWVESGRRVVPPVALLTLLQRGPFGEIHPAFLCQQQVAGGGILDEGVGAIPAGATLGNNTVSAPGGGAELAFYAGFGDQVIFYDRHQNDAPLGPDGTNRLPCAILGEALDNSGSLLAKRRARQLSNLRSILLDGNAALNRTIEYQDRLRQLAQDDPAAALRARLHINECLNTPTLSILCDRLPGSFSGTGAERPATPDRETPNR